MFHLIPVPYRTTSIICQNLGANGIVLLTTMAELFYMLQLRKGDSAMVKVLLSAGCNVNACEGCGATPLVLAVLKRNLDLCRILGENCAVYGEIFFVKVPSPFTIAQRLGEDAIVQLFQERTEQNQTFLDELIGKDKELQESQGSQQKKGGQATAEFVYDRTNIKSNPLCWRQEH